MQCLFPFTICIKFKFYHDQNNNIDNQKDNNNDNLLIKIKLNSNENEIQDDIVKKETITLIENLSDCNDIVDNNENKNNEKEKENNQTEKPLDYITKEIYDTEKKYVQELRIFRNGYLIPLREYCHRDNDNNDDKLNDIIDQLLGSIYNITACNEILLKNLQENLNTNMESKKKYIRNWIYIMSTFEYVFIL